LIEIHNHREVLMKKAPSSARTNVKEIEPFDKRDVSLTRFKPDISPGDWKELVRPSTTGIIIPPFLRPIDTLSPAKTVGLGRTNVTIIVPTIVQVDAARPFAAFDRQAIRLRNPVIQIHFEPEFYGITSTSDYVIEFVIEVFGQGTFNLQGGGGTVVNPGSKVVSGQAVVTLRFRNVDPAQETFAFLEQTAGARWNWFATRISFPPLVLEPA
jgi:hypothetical protein